MSPKSVIESNRKSSLLKGHVQRMLRTGRDFATVWEDDISAGPSTASEPLMMTSRNNERRKKSRKGSSSTQRASPLEKHLRRISMETSYTDELSTSHHTTDDAEVASPKCSHKKETDWKVKAQQLQIELAALRMHVHGVTRELGATKAALKQEVTTIQVMEFDQLDLQHDLDEGNSVRQRLERENVVLRKKLQKRENENEALRDEINQLKGIPSAHNVDFELERTLRHSKGRSMWSVLIDETVKMTSSLKEEDAGSSTESMRKSVLFGSLTHPSTRSLASHLEQNARVA